jgi:hypothetical protein
LASSSERFFRFRHQVEQLRDSAAAHGRSRSASGTRSGGIPTPGFFGRHTKSRRLVELSALKIDQFSERRVADDLLDAAA